MNSQEMVTQPLAEKLERECGNVNIPALRDTYMTVTRSNGILGWGFPLDGWRLEGIAPPVVRTPGRM